MTKGDCRLNSQRERRPSAQRNRWLIVQRDRPLNSQSESWQTRVGYASSAASSRQDSDSALDVSQKSSARAYASVGSIGCQYAVYWGNRLPSAPSACSIVTQM